ncbi:MarR family winged helix-turn-helix transcriptional regulator [Polymorphobacter sp. PAMC 29334]|uniref:MarR family winged helix-turn-helix transcriptional regulator n=1 Tax=Polymorphobacter sp. PAMC 29334 TaxID=2862331 RepID=UPI001D02D8B7|nr:MarR family transcriptional regulator [Polymorphobacter sp. PAMC 29334]
MKGHSLMPDTPDRLVSACRHRHVFAMTTQTIDSGSTPDRKLELGRTYLRLLRRNLLRIDRLSSSLIEPHGLTNQQFLALLLIRDNEGLSQAELTVELDSDQNTISAMVRRLATRDLITREAHPGDRRAVRLVVTEAGAALVAATLPDVDRLSLKLSALMPAKHEKAIVSWLEKIANLTDVG